MAFSKIEDIRILSDSQIEGEISKEKKALFNLRLKKGLGQNFRPHEFKHKKHRIAQLMFVESERQREKNVPSYQYQSKPRKSRTEVQGNQKRKITVSPDRSKPRQPHADIKPPQKDFMNKIDAHLLFEFGLSPNQKKSNKTNPKVRLNMLVHVSDLNWKPNKYTIFEENFRIGDIIGCSGNYETIIALQEDPGVMYVEYSHPMEESAIIDEGNWREPDLRSVEPLTKVINACAVQEKEKGKEAIVAIIDSGIDIFHEAFLVPNSNKTRIDTIFDIANNTTYNQLEIQNFLENASNTPPSLRDIRNSCINGHGTHVTSVAAGSPNKNFRGGIAPESELIIAVINYESTEGLSTQCGKALNLIIDRAKVLQKPVVINLSQGLNAGSHDGKSAFERILENSLGQGESEDIAIVKSAGNERKSNLHKCFNIQNFNPYKLKFRFMNNERDKEHIDLWFSPNPYLEFKLINPRNESTDTVNQFNKNDNKSFDNGNYVEIRYSESKSTGDGNLSIYICRETQSSRNDRISDGIWILEVSTPKTRMENTIIHAWIEIGASDRFHFIETGGIDEFVTITTPGNAENVIVVGSVKYISESIEEDKNSSCGPTRADSKKPETSAPGYKVAGAKAGTRDEVCEKNGSSVAAPHVTGAIALLLSALKKRSRRLTSSQIRAAIKASSKNSIMSWEHSTGFGLLDVEELFQRFNL